MLVTISAILGIWILYIIFEYRQRKPDQIVLFEKKNNIKIRKSLYYPRHTSLAISASVQSTMVEVVAEAKGHLLLNVRIAIAASASQENIDKLIRAGGWKTSSIKNAIEEIKVLIESYAKEFFFIAIIFACLFQPPAAVSDDCFFGNYHSSIQLY